MSGGQGSSPTRSRTPRSWLIVKSLQAKITETLTPFADNLTRQIKSATDLLVFHALGGHEDNLGANNFIIRRSIYEQQYLGALTWHGSHFIIRAYEITSFAGLMSLL